MEDKLLVFRCRCGNTDALRRIYEKYRDYLLVLGVALSKDINTAEDAVHDAFVSFAEKSDTFQLTGSLKAYLSVCVANRVRDHLRAKQNKPVSLDENFSSADLKEPSASVICSEQLQQLSSALAFLPHEQREVIALHIYSRLRFRQIASSLGVSINTVKGRYRYGITKLRSILDGEVE